MPEIVVAPLAFTTVEQVGVSNPANLGLERLGRAASFYASSASAAVAVTFDLGSAKPVDSLSLLAGSLFTSAATVIWTASNNLSALVGGTSLFSTGSVPYLASIEGLSRVHQQHLVKLPSVQTYRYWRAVITAGVIGNYAIGRAVLGKAFTPAEPRDYGWELRIVDMGALDRTQTGLEDILIRAKVMELQWTWGGLTKDEAENVAFELLAYAGITRDLLVCLDTDAANRHNLIGFGKLSEPSSSLNWAEGWYEMKVRQLSKLALAL